MSRGDVIRVESFKHSLEENDFFFFATALRYRFPEADFFLLPYVELEVGLLISSGPKNDVDGTIGLGIGANWISRWGFFAGPRVRETVILDGSDTSQLLQFLCVAGYRF